MSKWTCWRHDILIFKRCILWPRKNRKPSGKTKSHRIQDLVWWGTWRTLWILKNHDFIIIYDLYIYYNIMYKPKPTQNNCLSMIQRHRNPPCPAVLRAGWTARESSASAATCAVAALKCRFRAAPRRALNLRWGADDGRWRGGRNCWFGKLFTVYYMVIRPRF